MPDSPESLHAVPVAHLGAWVATVVTSPPPAPAAASRAAAAFPSAASATCNQCGIRLDGAELLLLSQPAPPAGDPPRIARLRQGYCARKACDASWYQVRLAPAEGVVWKPADTALLQLPSGDALPESPGTPAASGGTTRVAGAGFWSRTLRILAARHGKPVLLGVAVLIGLLAFRHWHLGGTIPYLREPEKFDVEVDPRYLVAPGPAGPRPAPGPATPRHP